MTQSYIGTVLEYPVHDDNLNPHCQRCDNVFEALERGIMRAALIVDIHSLYLGCLKKHPGKVVNYTAVANYFTAIQGNALFHKIAYGRQSEDKVPMFARVLRRANYQLVFGNAPHNVRMALEVADIVNNRSIEHLILGTSYFEAGEILAYARKRGIYTTVFGFDVPRAFDTVANVVELSEELLQVRPELEVHTTPEPV